MTMTTDELKARFSLAAHTAKNDQEIADAAASLPDGGANQIADFIATFCRAKGIDPQGQALQIFYKQTAEYKAAQDTEANRAAMKRAMDAVENFVKVYKENETKGATPNQEQLDTIAEEGKKYFSNLGAAQGKRRIYTAADYINECLTYDPSKDFTPALFDGLAFPDGTTSYIGARTSRGKTTAMVNIAREALDAKRKTIFITLEMSGKQIFNKLILSSALAASIKTGINISLENMPDPARHIYAVWKNANLPAGNATSANIYRQSLITAHSLVTAAQKEGAFILFDGRGASENEIINFIEAQAEKGTVVLLDYIQKMPSKKDTDTDSFRRVQAISYDVVNAAAQTNAVIIAGAQFNRTGEPDSLGDIFTDQSFRETGDIEQDAHNAIGIGWTKDKQSRFYEVLKTREDNKQGLLYNLIFNGGYSYMAHGERIYRPEGGNKPKANGKDKPKTTENTAPIHKGFI